MRWFRRRKDGSRRVLAVMHGNTVQDIGLSKYDGIKLSGLDELEELFKRLPKAE